MIAFNCGCGEPLAAAPEHAGLQVQCPKCDTRLTVPAAESEFEYADDTTPPAQKKAKLVDDKPKRERKPRNYGDDDAPDPVRRMMARAHAELDEDEARRERERGGVHFTPGIIGGAAVFIIFSLLAVVLLLMLLMYPAVGCLCVAMLGLARCVLSFLGQGLD